VLEAAQKNRLMIPGQRVGRIIEPERLIRKVANPNGIHEPSDFFRLAIGRRISHFRGQGQHVTPRHARELYVEEIRNMKLMDHAITEWEQVVLGESPGVNIKLFTGEIGVGKTHFLSVFLDEIAKRHPGLYKATILVRAELIERDRKSLLDVQRCVARSLYNDIDKRLKLAHRIREIMIGGYRKGVEPPIPKYREEIESWRETHVNQLLRVIGSICSKDSGIHVELGEQAPRSLCLFIDNSDQLEPHIVGELYNWANNISGDAGALLWVFLRPETYAYLQMQYQKAHISLRSSEPIYGPSLKDVVAKRIATFPNRFKAADRVAVSHPSFTFAPSDVQAAVAYLTDLTLETAEDMLPRLTDRPEEEGAPDLRAGLQGLLGILGSHIMSDEEYVNALLMRTAEQSATTSGSKHKGALERWPRVLEALILSRRAWYSSECGAVENLVDPPGIEARGDYFLLLHCLQVLISKPLTATIGELCTRLAKLGYTHGRVQDAIRHLATRHVASEDGQPDDDPFVRRTFPLALVENSGGRAPYRDETKVQITPWGNYHVKTLVWQAQYWKHIHYQIVLPGSVGTGMDPGSVNGTKADLRRELGNVFDYLIPIEKSWLHGKTESELTDIGLQAVMAGVRDRVLYQLR
jgi:hypothetical protein